MEHTFKFTDIDCLIILEALNYFTANEEIHQLDRDLARNIKNTICETVKKDKENNND